MILVHILLLYMSNEVLVNQVKAYSWGAPFSTCKDMRPQHGYAPLFANCPFDIRLTYADNLTTYSGIKERRKVIAILYSKKPEDTFSGFLAQVRSKTNRLYGKFLKSDNYQTMDCLGDHSNTVTQIDSTRLSEINLTWIPPEIPLLEHVEVSFHVTFVKNMDECWVGVKSKKFRIRRKFLEEYADTYEIESES